MSGRGPQQETPRSQENNQILTNIVCGFREQKKVYEERPLNDEIDTRPSWKLTTQDGAKLAGAED
jgi:hypothetical protein